MPNTTEFIWMIVSLILTLLVFSYLFGDNPVYRLVTALFIGVSAGYFAVVIIYQVILPRLYVPLIQGSKLVLIPLVLSGLLLLKLSPKLSKYGNISMAYLVGAGAAIAIGGAVLGTLFGQVKGAVAIFAPGSSNTFFTIIEGAFLLVGTLATMAYFKFGARSDTKRGPVTSVFAWVGKIFVAITLGSVFAGVLTAAITALVERTDFITQIIQSFLQ